MPRLEVQSIEPTYKGLWVKAKGIRTNIPDFWKRPFICDEGVQGLLQGVGEMACYAEDGLEG